MQEFTCIYFPILWSSLTNGIRCESIFPLNFHYFHSNFSTVFFAIIFRDNCLARSTFSSVQCTICVYVYVVYCQLSPWEFRPSPIWYGIFSPECFLIYIILFARALIAELHDRFVFLFPLSSVRFAIRFCQIHGKVDDHSVVDFWRTELGSNWASTTARSRYIGSPGTGKFCPIYPKSDREFTCILKCTLTKNRRSPIDFGRSELEGADPTSVFLFTLFSVD